MGTTKVDWNEDSIERLKALWASGKSCSQIACHFPNASRSAVIGKVHRLGMVAQEARKRVTIGVGPVVTPKARKPAPTPPAAALVILEPLVLENGAFVTMETVSNRTCRWPIGDPLHKDFHFCGNAPQKVGKPFCDAHAKKAYQPQQPYKKPVDPGQRALPIRRGQVSLWE